MDQFHKGIDGGIMRNNLGKFLVWMALLTLILLPFVQPVHAQDALQNNSSVTFESMEVDFWPEYDSPVMLVIYRIVLSPTQALPVEIKLQIPARAGDPNAVATQQTDGNLLTLDFTRQVNGDWATLAFTAPTKEIQVEYYDPALTRQGKQRQFEYRWLGDYAVKEFIFQVQQPTGATSVKITPVVDTSSLGGDGLMYYQTSLGSVAADQALTIAVEYQKDTDILTTTGKQVEPITPASELNSGRSWITTVLPWLLGALGVILIIGGGLWYWRSGIQSFQSPVARSRHKPASDRSVPAAPEMNSPDQPTVYCHECGNRANTGDRFCRTCGAQLRIG